MPNSAICSHFLPREGAGGAPREGTGDVVKRQVVSLQLVLKWLGKRPVVGLHGRRDFFSVQRPSNGVACQTLEYGAGGVYDHRRRML